MTRMTTDPKQLVNLATCWQCVPPGLRGALALYLLRAVSLTPVAGANVVLDDGAVGSWLQARVER